MYLEPNGADAGGGEALPATSFGEDTNNESAGAMSHGRNTWHRKSRSYTDYTDYDWGRHSTSSTQRRSRVSAEGDSFFSSNNKFDPAGHDTLRQSRNYGRKDPHLSATLPSRSFHTSQLPEPDTDEELLPLDAELSFYAQSPQRASMGPEDEIYAGESLALYSFEPENPNELRLKEGQIILVSYRHGQGWLVAEDPETGEQGLVPEEYVRLVREIESWDPERGGFIDDDGMLLDELGESLQGTLHDQMMDEQQDGQMDIVITPRQEIDMNVTLDDTPVSPLEPMQFFEPAKPALGLDLELGLAAHEFILDERPDSLHWQ